MRQGMSRLLVMMVAITLGSGCPGSKDLCEGHSCPETYVCEAGLEEGCGPEDNCSFKALCVCGYGSVDSGEACVDACTLEGWADKANNGCTALAGADLQGASLEDALLTEADLSGAALQGANLKGANLADAKLKDADLSDARLEEAYLQGADLTNARFVGTNLASANLDEATLEGADFSDATFDFLRGQQVIGCPSALPADWACLLETLLGPSASLQGVDLSGQSLQGLNLRDALLQNAKLQGADLGDSDLSGALFEGADLTGVSWVGATCPDGMPSADFGDSCCGNLLDESPVQGCE